MVNAKDLNNYYSHVPYSFVSFFKESIRYFHLEEYFLDYVIHLNYYLDCLLDNDDLDFAYHTLDIIHEYLLYRLNYMFDDFNLYYCAIDFLKSPYSRLIYWLNSNSNFYLSIVGFNYEEECKKWIKFQSNCFE